MGNGFGKLMGALQVRELGEIESPVVLTCTLCVPRAADAVLGEATEEAALNSLFRAETVRGAGGTVRALPLDSVLPVLHRHGVVP